jgi:hypothetical protein
MKFSYLVLNRLLNIFLLLLFICSFLNLDEIITQFVKDYQSLFILIYLVSLSIIIYECLKKLLHNNKLQRVFKNNEQRRLDNLSSLSIDEKYILSKYFDNETTEYAFDTKNISVQLLIQKELLVRTSRTQNNKTVFLIDLTTYQLLRKFPKYIY